MVKGQPSGYSLDKNDARIVLGMQARGDRNHDIAAWFGVNQGRVAEAKQGQFGTLEVAPEGELPPRGAPGIKGRKLRAAVEKTLNSLSNGDGDEAASTLQVALRCYDADEI